MVTAGAYACNLLVERILFCCRRKSVAASTPTLRIKLAKKNSLVALTRPVGKSERRVTG